MKKPVLAIALLLGLGLTLDAVAAPQMYPQQHQQPMPPRHDQPGYGEPGHSGEAHRRVELRKGNRLEHDRGQRVDYRRYHLRKPRRGQEWRQVDDRYVLVAVATGAILSVVLAH